MMQRFKALLAAPETEGRTCGASGSAPPSKTECPQPELCVRPHGDQDAQIEREISSKDGLVEIKLRLGTENHQPHSNPRLKCADGPAPSLEATTLFTKTCRILNHSAG